MKDLLSKEHYCYKIHTLLMKSSAYPSPSIDTSPPIWATPLPFLQENCDPPFYDFSDIPTPLITKGVHSMKDN